MLYLVVYKSGNFIWDDFFMPLYVHCSLLSVCCFNCISLFFDFHSFCLVNEQMFLICHCGFWFFQEAFVDPSRDESLVFELLDFKHDVGDAGSAVWFLQDLEHEQEAEQGMVMNV